MARKNGNKQLLFLSLALVIVLGAWFFLPDGSNAVQTEATTEQDDFAATTLVKIGDTAPDFNVVMSDGTTIDLAALRGKVVLLNFWATWCPPCREELKRVEGDIIERFRGKEFVFLPISRGETLATVTEFLNSNGYTFAAGIDSEQTIYHLYASNYIPRNFLINREGKVVMSLIGYEPGEFDTLIKTIEKTLE